MGQSILAVGAAGNFAGLVVRALAERGAKVRGLIHSPEHAVSARRNGATEIAVGDLRDPRSIAVALTGIDYVFYIAPAFMADEAEVGVSLVSASQRAGVRRFVFSSVIHPVLSILVNHAAKPPVEQAVLLSGMEYTFLHPAVFYQNFEFGWHRTSQTGVISQPWSIDTRFTRVDFRDVAECAAIALTDDRLLYGTFELCADGRLCLTEVADLISTVLNRPMAAKRVDPRSLEGLPHGMLTMFGHYDHHGISGNSLILRAILERPPRTLRAYFEELRDRECSPST
jgi:uncharacterized protein YbjT (DUF2867 family)